MLTKEYKWDYYRLVEGMYSMLPPEKIRSRCGLNYHEKVIPALKEKLDELGVDTSNYPRFHADTEEQMKKILRYINLEWSRFIEKEIKRKHDV